MLFEKVKINISNVSTKLGLKAQFVTKKYEIFFETLSTFKPNEVFGILRFFCFCKVKYIF